MPPINLNREATHNKRKRASTIPNAKMVVLVGGGHSSVEEIRRSFCYCMLAKVRLADDMRCADCPFRE